VSSLSKTTVVEGPPGQASPDDDALPVVTESRYEVHGELARGGMGRVLLATDRLGREVVLKELLEDHAHERARFVREALVTARLQHPSIVPLYEAGRQPDGSPFYTMRRITGEPLSERIRSATGLRERLALLPTVIAVAEAIAYAHSQRVIHRDLKPSNVVVGGFGETIVIDWGLAKVLGEPDEPGTGESVSSPPIERGAGGSGTDLTAQGVVLGTPAYMSPEQALGLTLDERSDVYAIGAILYALLTGAAPYSGESNVAVLSAVLSAPPPAPQQREPGVPDELAAVVAKAMAREPEHRYPSALGLAHDLRSFQTGQLVGAYRYSTRELAARWARRRARLLGVVAVATVALTLSTGVSLRRIVRERDRADNERAAALAARADAQRAEQAATRRADELVMLQARRALDSGGTAAVQWLSQLSTQPGVDWRAAREIASEARFRGVARTEKAHSLDVYALAFAPTGDALASGSGDRTVRIARMDATGRPPSVLTGHEGEVAGVAYSADGRWLATASLDRTVRLWDLQAGTSRVLGSHEDIAIAVAITPDGSRVASGSADGTCAVWDVATGGHRACAAGARAVYGVAFAPDGMRVVSGAADGNIRVLSLDTGRERVLRTGSPIRAIALAPDGGHAAVGNDDHAVHLWDLATGASRTLFGFTSFITGIDFSRDGRRVAASSRKEVMIGDLRLGTVRTLPADNPSAVALSPDGRSVAVGLSSGAVQLFPVEAGQIDLHVEEVPQALATARTGARIAVGTRNAIEMFDLTDGTRGRQPMPNGALGVALTADAQQVLVGDRSGAVSLLPFAGGKARVIASPDGHSAPAVACSHGGTRVAWATEDGRARVLDLATGAVASLSSGGTGFYELAFSPDDARLAGANWDKTVVIWTLATQARTVLTGHQNWVVTLDYASDGRWLASGSVDRDVRLWDLATDLGTDLGRDPGSAGDAGTSMSRVLSGHPGSLSSVRFSPDHERLASADAKGFVRLWDVATGALLLERQHDASDAQVAFLADGRVVDAFPDGTVRVWSDDLPVGPEPLRAWMAESTRPIE
jgi:WD40 repeat protein